MSKKKVMESLRKKSVKEIVSTRKKRRDELFEKKIKNKTGWKKPHEIKKMRKDIARANTVLTDKISN